MITQKSYWHWAITSLNHFFTMVLQASHGGIGAIGSTQAWFFHPSKCIWQQWPNTFRPTRWMAPSSLGMARSICDTGYSKSTKFTSQTLLMAPSSTSSRANYASIKLPLCPLPPLQRLTLPPTFRGRRSTLIALPRQMFGPLSRVHCEPR